MENETGRPNADRAGGMHTDNALEAMKLDLMACNCTSLRIERHDFICEQASLKAAGVELEKTPVKK